MECNKDEAIRAMGIAEKRMQNSDFEGALKVGKKAKQLFPEVENISQLLAVCEVHCSALHKLYGSTMDWYRILQTEKLADEATVKRQYRKLALLLHPDKNKYAGAEAAFKLVGEAHRMLSDQVQRSLYDMKYTCLAKPAASVTTQVDGEKPYSMRFPHGNQPVNHKVPSKQRPPKVTSQTGRAKPSSMRSPVGFGGSGQDSKAGNSAELHGGFKTEVEPDYHVDMEGVEVPKSNVEKSGKLGSSKSGSRKRNNAAVKANESCEPGVSDINAKNVGMHKFGINLPGKNSGNERRQNQSVHRQKNLKSDDDDFVDPLKQEWRSYSVCNEAMKETSFDQGISTDHKSASCVAEDKQKAGAPGERRPNKKIRIDEYYTQKEVAKSDIVDRNPKFDDVPILTSVISFEVPDTQFNDFEACKKDNCFAVNQMWAIYDPVDGMPRFYARIKKVLSPGFKVHITWLEADPDGQDEVDWCNADLPISCGKYKLGATEESVDCLMFSHQMQCIKGSGRASYLVYPRKGETWALFKDWDIRWSSDPKKTFFIQI